MYKLEVTHREDYSFYVNSGAEEFIIDAKKKGSGPLDMLLAGLASCIGVYVRKYSEGARLGLNNFKVNIEAELTRDPPFRFQEIKVCLDLNGSQIDERRKNAILEFIKNCPAHNTLKNNPSVELKIC